MPVIIKIAARIKDCIFPPSDPIIMNIRYLIPNKEPIKKETRPDIVKIF